MATLTGQKTKDNIEELAKTDAVRWMVVDLFQIRESVEDVKKRDFSIFNAQYRKLGGNVQPKTLGAVQDAVCLLLGKVYDKEKELK